MAYRWVLSPRWRLDWRHPDASLAQDSAQPLDAVRDYFGEKVARSSTPTPTPYTPIPLPLLTKVALYFAFLEAISRDLAVPAAVGLLMLLLQAAYGTTEQPLLPLYSASLLLWAPWVEQNWRRQEHRLAARWATADFEEEEPHRHEFRGARHRGVHRPPPPPSSNSNMRYNW